MCKPLTAHLPRPTAVRRASPVRSRQRSLPAPSERPHGARQVRPHVPTLELARGIFSLARDRPQTAREAPNSKDNPPATIYFLSLQICGNTQQSMFSPVHGHSTITWPCLDRKVQWPLPPDHLAFWQLPDHRQSGASLLHNRHVVLPRSRGIESRVSGPISLPELAK